jgi:hypothetical protein
MTQTAKKLLEEFDALEEEDRAEVLAELLRRVAVTPHDLPHPGGLVTAANQLFIELDDASGRGESATAGQVKHSAFPGTDAE